MVELFRVIFAGQRNILLAVLRASLDIRFPQIAVVPDNILGLEHGKQLRIILHCKPVPLIIALQAFARSAIRPEREQVECSWKFARQPL